MIPLLADRLRPRDISATSRRNFRFELGSVGLMAAGLACVDVNVLGVLAKKAFAAGPWTVTLIAASDAIANITSLFWTRLLHGTDRVRSANVLQFCTIACVVGIALTPFTWWGGWMLAGLAILARVFFTGIINARTDLWRANYPREARARVIARFTIVGTFVIATTGLLIALSMDFKPGVLRALGFENPEGHAFRLVYLLAAVVAAGGALLFARVRWRGRRVQMALERGARTEDGLHAASARAMLRVLREDREYRRFMAAQFVLGAPNLAAAPVFILALDRFTLDYTQSITLTRVIPILVPVAVTPLWGRLLDRMHIVRFRAYHSWVFVVANAMMAGGFLLMSLPLLYASRIVLGVAFAGGLLAWELGHHDFAKRETAAVYMGVHVTLTGIRGVFAPFLGTLLFGGASLEWAGAGEGARLPGMGAWLFVLLAAVSAVGGWMFVRLYRDTRERTGVRPVHD
ncbi:MAG: hypothetical protein SFZ24_06010 [Planctomycetota bacterium]|nr:hypothetical protein [Planctomycetota bacterium]